MPHRIAVVALDGAIVFDLGIPRQIFGPVLDEAGQPAYEVAVCTPTGGGVRTNAGFTLVPQHGLELLRTADTIVIPGPSGESLAGWGEIPIELSTALNAAHDRGVRIMSICTGAFVLAAAGLLDGRTATTHWFYAERFRSLFPGVQLDTDVLYIDGGDILTSAGVAAGIDLCLHVVRGDHGVAAAAASARRAVVSAARPGGQAQFIERPMPGPADAGVPAVMHWAATHLESDLSLELLAGRARMSIRSFTRRFRDYTGQSPAAWITAQRLGFARELLETTDLYVDEIARQTGIGSAAHLRAMFQRSYRRTPTDYRRDFATTQPQPTRAG